MVRPSAWCIKQPRARAACCVLRAACCVLRAAWGVVASRTTRDPLSRARSILPGRARVIRATRARSIPARSVGNSPRGHAQGESHCGSTRHEPCSFGCPVSPRDPSSRTQSSNWNMEVGFRAPVCRRLPAMSTADEHRSGSPQEKGAPARPGPGQWRLTASPNCSARSSTRMDRAERRQRKGWRWFHPPRRNRSDPARGG